MCSFNFIATLRENLCSERQLGLMTQEQPSSSPVATVSERGDRDSHPPSPGSERLVWTVIHHKCCKFAPVSCIYPSQPHGWSPWGTHSLQPLGLLGPGQGQAGCCVL